MCTRKPPEVTAALERLVKKAAWWDVLVKPFSDMGPLEILVSRLQLSGYHVQGVVKQSVEIAERLLAESLTSNAKE